MRGVVLVVGGGERGGSVSHALLRRGLDSVFADDSIAAMAALGRAPFRSLVVLGHEKSAAVPLRTLLRVARHRHPGIQLVVVRAFGRAPDPEAPGIVELALDASDDDLAQVVSASTTDQSTFDEVTAEDKAPVGPLLDGTLAAGGSAVLATVFAQELTGQLRIEAGAAAGTLWFAAGEPVAVDERDAARTGANASDVLAGLRAKVRERVTTLIEQNEGAYTFVEDRGFLDVRILTKVSPFGLMLDVRRKTMTPASLLSVHSDMAAKFVWPGVGLERASGRLKAFTRDKDVATVIGRGETTVDALLSQLGLDPLMGTLVVLTLVDARLATLHESAPHEPTNVHLGDLDAAPNPFTLADHSMMATQPEAEAMARLYLEMKPATDPRIVLGLGPKPTAEDVEDAYRKRMAALSDVVGFDQRLDELRRKADQARTALLAETTPMKPARGPTGGEGAGGLSSTGEASEPGALERVGRYEILKKIGQGGMAEVFLGRRVGVHGFEKRVVIKRILPQWADDRDVVRMFLEEARTAARITHPNVVQIYDLGESGARFYIVMEYVDGPNLDELLATLKAKGEWMTHEIAATIVAQMCAGLHAAHANRDDHGRPVPIIHRDVSTQNVLVARDGHVKLTDFGVAKRADAMDRTVPGILKGKPHYLAPEYILGAPADARSDVFAAGLVLYVSLAMVHPFERMTPDESMRAVLASSFPSIEKLRPDLPKALVHLVERAMHPKVEQRFQTANSLQLALESFCAASGRMPTPASLAAFVQAATTTKQPPGASTEGAPFEEQTLELTWPFER